MFSRALFAEFFPFDLPKLAYVDTDIRYYSDKDMGDEKKKDILIIVIILLLKLIIASY